jgi:hypothetical protein
MAKGNSRNDPDFTLPAMKMHFLVSFRLEVRRFGHAARSLEEPQLFRFVALVTVCSASAACGADFSSRLTCQRARMEVAQRNSLAVTFQLRLAVNAPGVETRCDIDYPVYVDTSNVRIWIPHDV